MTKIVDSDALAFVTRALGLTGAGAATTELIDGTVDQVLDIVPLVRRGRTFASTQGIFTGILQNVHTDAESLLTSVDPYEFGATGLVAPWPSPVPPQFDIWLLGAVVRRESGSGTFTGILETHIAVQGWGIDDSGVAVVSTLGFPIVRWDAVVTETIVFGVTAGGELPYAPIGMRLPRSGESTLAFRSTSSLTSTYSCQVVLGLFPVSLGQDGMV